jgi:WD40 repeat protein
MTVSTVGPPSDAWVAAIHASEGDFAPRGTGLVIDERRVLTCAHVVRSADGPMLWVAFPKGDDPLALRVPVTDIRVAGAGMADLAVLHLAAPVPQGVTAAPLRCPKPVDLVGHRWWAFGFASGDPLGNAADGAIGAALGYGWLRVDADSRYHVEPGFSGGGLWSPDYGAVVGVVGEANDRGDGRAITLHQADLCFPDEKIRALAEWSVQAAGEMALAAWGWTLTDDPEARRHWRPRARGVSVESERRYRFRGRDRALAEIVNWLDRNRLDRKVLVVTGSPGVGKSAVLGRVVTTADASIAAALPADDDAVRATVGSVSCAVHAKGKTALDVAMEVARAASSPLPERLEDFAPGLRESLAERGNQRFNIIMDALDEATNPVEARAIITRVVLPIAETCADVGAQVVVGTRRADDDGDLLRHFGPAANVVNLDRPEYFSIADLAEYALATLQLRGDERPGNPYADDSRGRPAAERIAALADQNFLVAGLIARGHGLHDQTAVDPGKIWFTATVESALATYLERVPAVDGVPATEALTALAFAEAQGLTVQLWQVAMRAVTGRALPVDRLTRFARGSAANFLVESNGQSQGTSFRLFHQALSDALVRERARAAYLVNDERALTHAFLEYGARTAWYDAPDYLFRSLPGHAVRTGLVDELLADDEYLLHADLRRLIPAASQAATAVGRQRARLLSLTPRAVSAGPEDRAALFSVTEAFEGLGTTYRDRAECAPYRAMWAAVPQRMERAVLEGHTSGVKAVCSIEAAGRTLLASAGSDRTVRLWDPATGECQRTLKGHTAPVNAVCPIRAGGRTLLASAGGDRTVRIWDPATGEPQHIAQGTSSADALCTIQIAGRTLLASAGYGGAIRLWDPATGENQRTWKATPIGGVHALCPIPAARRTLLASASDDRTVRLWDPAGGEHRHALGGHTDRVNAVCPIQVAGRTLLASAGNDATVRLWDPATGENQRTWRATAVGGVRAVCPIHLGGRTLLASASDDHTVRLWDPATGEAQHTLKGHTKSVNALCPIQIDGRTLLASASDDHTFRLWDPATGEAQHTLEDQASGVNALCPIQVAARTVLASADDDRTVRLWDPSTGEAHRMLKGHTNSVNALCPIQVSGRTLLASAGDGGAMRLWDPATGECPRNLKTSTNWVSALCPIELTGRTLLASAGDDGTVRLWDLATGGYLPTLKGHNGWVNALCPIEVAGRTLLASAGDDRTVRLWDINTGRSHHQLVPVYHDARALVSPSPGSLVVGLSAGLLALTVTWRDKLRGSHRGLAEIVNWLDQNRRKVLVVTASPVKQNLTPSDHVVRRPSG